MNQPAGAPARARDEPGREERRRAIEQRARSEALARDELARAEALRAELAELELRATRPRRYAAAVTGSHLWGLLAGDRRIAGAGDSAAEHRGAALRRRRFRLTRRKRTLEHGATEPPRAAARRLGHRASRPSGRLSRPRVLSLPLPRASQRETDLSLVLATRPAAVPWAVLRAARLRPRQIVIAPTHRHALGSAIEAAAQRATGDIVVIATAAAGLLPDRLQRLVEPLRADTELAAIAETAVRFEWTGAAPHPIAALPAGLDAAIGDLGAPRPAVALTGSLAALRRELLAQNPPCAGYRGPLWLTDLSLAAVEAGYRLAAVPSIASGAAPATPLAGDPPQEDLTLLRKRWGAAIRQRVLADLLVGGGEWCGRAARVAVDPECPPAVASALGQLKLDRVDRVLEADVAIATDANGQLSCDWILAGEHNAASTGVLADCLDGAGGQLALAEALSASASAPAFCIRIAGRDWDAAGRGGDAALARSLARALGEQGHQALLQVDADADHAAGDCLDVLLALRGRRIGEPSPGRLNLIWQISHPEEVKAAELNLYDRVLVASRHHAERLRETIHPTVDPLLQFTDPEVFHPAAANGPTHDVVFVGNWRGEFRRIVWDALETGCAPALYGRGWDLLAPELAVAEYVPHDELHRLYSSSKIVLCDHWDDMRRLGFVSNRVFDALACEAFAIADDNPALAEELPGMVETYSSAAELGDKVKHYLDNPRAREQIARRGRALVLAEHSVERRAEQLLVLATAAARECRRPMTAHLREHRSQRWNDAPEGDVSVGAAAGREAGAGLA